MRTSFLRWFCGAALLLAASSASAANPVPGLEVVARQGSAIVFRGVTNGKGRFETGPLEPGVYTVEVRTVPNTPATSARFFLALAGAKPIGEPTIRPGVAVAMDAMVRNPVGIRGQVTARGGIVYVPRPSPSGTPASTSPGNVPLAATPAFGSAPTQTRPRVVSETSSASAAANWESTFVRRPASAQPRIINGRRYTWVPISVGSNLGRWQPETVARPMRNTLPAPSLTPSRTRR